MLFLASGKEKVLKSESYTDKIFPHLSPQKILQHIQLYIKDHPYVTSAKGGWG